MPPLHLVLQQQREVLELLENNLRIIALVYNLVTKMKNKRKHRWWVRSTVQKRKDHGAYLNLVRELQEDGEKFKEYFRLTREQFAQVLFFVGEDLVLYSRCREVISPKERLAICLR